MMLTVRLFARGRDLAGADRVTVELPAGATVGDVRRRLITTHPRLGDLASRCAVAVDAEFADDDHIVTEAAEIALLPPVSGG
jgi:molybdopterin converting factor subunit 1